MSDYTQTTDFSAKDSLPTGNAAKVIKGSDMDTELAAISTAITSKAENATDETISGNWTHSGATTCTGAVDVSGATSVTGLDWELVGTATASADEYLTFASLFDWSTYHEYRFALARLRSTTDARNIAIQVGTGAGPTWITSYAMSLHGLFGGTVIDNQNGTTFSYAVLGTTLGTGSVDAAISGELVFSAGNDSIGTRVHIGIHTYGQSSAGTIFAHNGIIAPLTNGVEVTSIRFTPVTFTSWSVDPTHTAEEITDGEIRVYGLRNA